MEMIDTLKNKAKLDKAVEEYRNQKCLAKVSRLIVDEMYNRNIPDKEFARIYGISNRNMEDIEHFEYNPSLLELIELFGRMELDLEIILKPRQKDRYIGSIPLSAYLKMRDKCIK